MDLRTDFVELELMELFLSPPDITDSRDGIYCFKSQDDSGVVIVFSANVINETVRVQLKKADVTLVNLFIENVKRLVIDKEERVLCLYSMLCVDGLDTSIYIKLKPNIEVGGNLFATLH